MYVFALSSAHGISGVVLLLTHLAKTKEIQATMILLHAGRHYSSNNNNVLITCSNNMNVFFSGTTVHLIVELLT